ncbi:glycoside hydrolase family 31 protein [Haloimpatiens sp. FM7330]|uniref:glycoside hydrolase family 31 protein n=1 Tax=Haloimpatiens sp. FM7330 TaxID=3298610 RepID=UPI003635E28A
MKTEKDKELNRDNVLKYAGEKSEEKVREAFDTNRQFESCGDFQEMKIQNNNIVFGLTNSIIKLYVLTDKIVKIEMVKYPQNIKNYSKEDLNDYFEKVCKREYKKTQAVSKQQWNKVDFHVKEDSSQILIKTSILDIQVNKTPFSICFKDQGKVINKDLLNKGMGNFGEGVCCYKELQDNEHFYGFGEKTGSLDKQKWDTINWNTDNPFEHNDETKSLYSSIPFFIGLNNNNAYGIYFDNTYKTYFNMGKDNSDYYYFASEKGELVYYFIYGPSIKQVLEGYTEITGRMKMPPMWTLGYQQCRWSYYPQSEVLNLTKTFREKDIPCDTIYLDIDYMDAYRVFTWDNQRFPNYKGMINELHDNGFKLVTIIDPGVKIDKDYRVYKEGVENNYFLKDNDGNVLNGKVWPMDSAFPDFSNEKVRNWWGGLNSELINIGVDGIWNDMNEPSLFDAITGTIPKDIIHNSDEGAITHEEFHNLYGMMEDKATFEGMIKADSNKRTFLLSRSAFAGIQRYSALWTGDNQSLWDHLKLSIPMNCNLGLSGVSFVGNDVGGFGGHCTEELLVRWTQVGTFLPMFRNHSAMGTRNQEPWAFDKNTEDICRKYIKLRYEILPYLYNVFYDAAEEGQPILRPLIYEFQNDSKAVNINDEFMLGENILVAPILEEGCIERNVYLPQGKWVDYWTGKEYEGNNTIGVSAPLDIIPVFIKSGSIIPKYKCADCTDKLNKQELILDIVPNENSVVKYSYYEDDGCSFDYEKGKYAITNMVLEQNDEKYTLKIDKVYKEYSDSFNSVHVNIINCIQPKEVRVVNTKENSSTINYEYKNNALSFDAKFEENLTIEVIK